MALFPTGRSGLSEIHVGAYRTEPMQVVSGMFGREKVHYRAPEAENVPSEIKTFIGRLRFSQKEVTLQGLADTFFAFLKMG